MTMAKAKETSWIYGLLSTGSRFMNLPSRVVHHTGKHASWACRIAEDTENGNVFRISNEEQGG